MTRFRRLSDLNDPPQQLVVPWTSPPDSATAVGTAGQIAYDGGSFFYVCTASNTWRRTALSSWSLDPYIANVALLLHMDGTGSTFIDSSPTPKTITAVGNATQSTTQSRWGGKSCLCDGSGDYLTLPTPTFSSSNFVIEGWFYLTTITSGIQVLWSARSSESVIGGPTIAITGSSGQLAYYIANSSATAWEVSGTQSGLSLAANQWQHIALVRSGSSVRLYVDGTGGTAVSVPGSIGTSGDFSLMAGTAIGAQEVTGYVDDFRITIGTDRGFSSTITVPTAAFPNP